MTSTPAEPIPGAVASTPPVQVPIPSVTVLSEMKTIEGKIAAAMSLQEDVALLKRLTGDAEAALAHVHGAGKTLTTDLKAAWVPLLTIAVILSLGLHVLHFVLGL